MTFTDTLIGRPSTVKNQTYMFNKWIKPHMDSSFDEMVLLWTKSDLSPRSQTFLISLAARFFEWKDGVRPVNARAVRSKIARLIPADPPKALTKAQAQKLLAAWEELYPRYIGIFLMGYHCGMRVSEVFNVTWGDINYLRSQVTVRGMTKNGKGRLIPLSRKLEQTLQKTDNLIGRDLDSPIFPSIKVNPRLKKACERAGVPVITFHWLRHTWATLALESGANIKAVSETLGHSSVQTTLDIYWHCLGGRIDLGFLDE